MTSIVVVDDHQIVREGIVKLLEEREGFHVVGQAGDGEEAVEIVLEKQPDVVIMDVRMPRLSGVDATRRILKRGSEAKVVILSTHDGRNHVEQALRAGAAGYLSKPARLTNS